MCDEAGITTDEFFKEQEEGGWILPLNLNSFMNEHSEFERIEIDGELITREELNNRVNEAVASYFASFSDAAAEEIETEAR